MQCAVCGAEAEDLTPGDFDGLIVRCKRCGDYAITGGALNKFLRLDFDRRRGLLEEAWRASLGTRPMISDVPHPE